MLCDVDSTLEEDNSGLKRSSSELHPPTLKKGNSERIINFAELGLGAMTNVN